MAPRRGGGGVSTSFNDGDSSSIWTERTVLFGSDLNSGFTIAEVVIEVICVFALIFIAAFAAISRKRSDSSRAVIKWFRFGLAILFALM